MGWPYVVLDVFLGPAFFILAGCSRNGFFCGLYWLPIVIESWLLLTCSCMGSALRLADSWTDPIPAYKPLCRRSPQEAELASAEFGACWDLPLHMLLVKLIGTSSEVDVVWSWPPGIFVLGPLEGGLLQAEVRCCLCLALSNLFGATSNPQFVSCSGGPGSTQKGSSCSPRLVFTSTWLRAFQQMP